MSRYHSHHHHRYAMERGSQLSDPFAVDPIRRSATIVLLSLAILLGPFLVSPEFGAGMMIAVGWLAATGVIFCVPILIWSLIEEAVRMLQRRIQPPVDELNLTPRIIHNLQRHGYATIRAIHLESDTSLLLLSNMESADVRQIRRAINLWRYARWQAQGFPVVEQE